MAEIPNRKRERTFNIIHSHTDFSARLTTIQIFSTAPTLHSLKYKEGGVSMCVVVLIY